MKQILNKLVQGKGLSLAEAEASMEMVMGGEATSAQIASFITALRIKGETAEEIAGAARAMRAKAAKIPHHSANLVDTCGTGGDLKHTFNISTIAAFVVAGAGIPVAKHGNRAVSSRCGSADLLAELGVKIDIGPDKVAECIDKIGIGFLFAPNLHQAMKHAVGPRRELGFRTIFNLLGPLTNPAGADFQLLGVYSPDLTELIARVLGQLGCRHALVVHGEDGLDEITITTRTKVSEYVNGEVRTYWISPADFGLPYAKPDDLSGADPQYNARLARSILEANSYGPQRHIVLLNAAAAIYAAGLADDMHQCLTLAQKSLDYGAAAHKLEDLIRLSNS